jgi:hypothetical protein
VFDALLLLIGDPGEIDVPSEAPSSLAHAVRLLALALLAAGIVMIWKHGALVTSL